MACQYLFRGLTGVSPDRVRAQPGQFTVPRQQFPDGAAAAFHFDFRRGIDSQFREHVGYQFRIVEGPDSEGITGLIAQAGVLQG